MNTTEKVIINKLSNVKSLISQYHNTNVNKETHTFHCNFDDDVFASRQFDILHLIITENINTVSNLAKYFDLSASSLSITISKMCSANLIEKSYDETSDSRNVVLKPTQHALDVHEEIKHFTTNNFKEFYNSLNKEELEIFSSALYDLSSSLQLFKIHLFTNDIELDKLSELIFENLFKLKAPFEQFFRDAKNKYKDNISLTDREIGILDFLSQPNINTPSELSCVTFTKESTISSQLKGLVKKGYLRKEKSDKDIRKTYFIITELGQTTFDNDINIIQNIFAELLETFSEDDKQNLTNGLSSLEVLFNLLLQHNNKEN